MSFREMQNRVGLDTTIDTLRIYNDAHAEVIARLEDYQRTVGGFILLPDESKTGFRNGYAAEISYLQMRRDVVDALIASMERYQDVSGVAAVLAGQSVYQG